MLNVSAIPMTTHCHYSLPTKPAFIAQKTSTNTSDTNGVRPRPFSAFSPVVHVPVPVRPLALLPVTPPIAAPNSVSQKTEVTDISLKTSEQVRDPSRKRKFADTEDSIKDEEAQEKVITSRKRTKREDASSSSSGSSSNDDEELDDDSTSSSSAPPSPTSLSFAVPSRGPFMCPVEHCDCRYTRRYDMKMHFLSKHPEQVPLFPEILNLKKSSKDGKKWQCPFPDCVCGYSRKGDLKGHLLKRHPGECKQFPDILRPRSTKENKKFQCPIPNCQCGYMRKFDLKSHVYAKHPDQIHLFEEEFENHDEA